VGIPLVCLLSCRELENGAMNISAARCDSRLPEIARQFGPQTVEAAAARSLPRDLDGRTHGDARNAQQQRRVQQPRHENCGQIPAGPSSRI